MRPSPQLLGALAGLRLPARRPARPTPSIPRRTARPTCSRARSRAASPTARRATARSRRTARARAWPRSSPTPPTSSPATRTALTDVFLVRRGGHFTDRRRGEPWQPAGPAQLVSVGMGGAAGERPLVQARHRRQRPAPRAALRRVRLRGQQPRARRHQRQARRLRARPAQPARRRACRVGDQRRASRTARPTTCRSTAPARASRSRATRPTST